MKPLGRKAYGSIPHLPGSRLGPGEHHCHEGQAGICTIKVRDKHDRVIVTEKLDGSCVTIAAIGGGVVAINRAGYLCETAPTEQHRMFARWVEADAWRLTSILQDGERICGEWLAMAHGTRYSLKHQPFVAFDLMVADKRRPWDELLARCAMIDLPTAAVLSDGPPMLITDALEAVAVSKHGAIDPVEGAVWKVERKGEFDFNAKFVRHDKIDGKYFGQISGGSDIWNWQPNAA